MKSKVIWLFAILLVGTAVASSQHPPQPAQPQQPGQPGQPLEGPPPQAVGPHQPGQPQQPTQPPQPNDPIAGNLFPAELVMQHRRELGLTDEQKAAIRDEAIKASTRFNELQWQMQDEIETMANLMKGATVDEQKALAQLDKVLNIEREVKRTQLGLSIRIKNKLTPEQQGKLHELQRYPPPPR
jgi:Spy/CpxP family protein refolding chaperone